ncbi:tetratricopeptide repeat-containing sensor histidine kinase [Pinibacter soli]|uniref:histidine kinase n=1 Tax=Pinibacter soli TaxID=3044211 RepID=A0ABT6RJ89_9BACT|nr:histidine kinase [Pinibacter soli]MDI3322588.1 histidine kinase [Pinibacter soli]
MTNLFCRLRKKCFSSCQNIFLLLFIFFAFCTTSAQANGDENFENIGENDTTAILSLIHKGEDLSVPSTAFQNLSTALDESYKLHYSKGIAFALAGLGNWYFGNDINRAVYYGNLAQNIYDKYNLNDVKLKAKIHLLLGTSLQEKGIRDSAGYYFFFLADDIKNPEINDPVFEINAYVKLTAFLIDINYNATHLQRIGKEYIDKARSAIYRTKDTAEARLKLCFLEGMYYHGIKQYDSARYYYLQILDKKSLKNINTARVIAIYLNLSSIYLQEKNADKAMMYVQKIIDISKQPGNQQYLLYYMSITNIMHARVLFLQKEYEQALSLINYTLDKLRKNDNVLNNEIIIGYETAAECYEALGKFNEALAYKDKYTKLHDSLMQKDKLDMISQLEMRYSISEKDKEIAKQQLTKTETESRIRKKNFWIGVIVLITIGLMIIFLLWQRNNLHKQKLQQEKINSFNKQIEIEKLNAAISGEERERTRIARDLHDGIGGMLAVSKMNFEISRQNVEAQHREDFQDGIKLLEQAASELRKTAHNMMPQILLEEGLVDAVKYFCDGVAKSNAPDISFQIFGTPKKFAPEFELAIYRIVQELIHNVIRHADAKNAIVQFNFHETSFTVTVEDDGIGMSTEEGIKGMGMRSIQDRITTNHGTISIESRKNEGTSVYLEFESQPETIQLI